VGDKQVQKLDQINNNPAVKDAVKDTKQTLDTTIKDCCKSIVQAINDIKITASGSGGSASAPTPQPPNIINQITVNIKSELKEKTQKDILRTLKGYFVNQ